MAVFRRLCYHKSMDTDLSFEQTLGAFLQKARVVRNQTQEELASTLNISVRVLRKLESGQAVSSATFLKALRELGYEKDLLEILSYPKPKTIEQHQALANGARLRKRAR